MQPLSNITSWANGNSFLCDGKVNTEPKILFPPQYRDRDMP